MTNRPRRVLQLASGQRTRAYQTQSFMFGNTEQERNRAYVNELHAYYCLFPPSEIKERTYMTQQYVGDTMTKSNVW